MGGLLTHVFLVWATPFNTNNGGKLSKYLGVKISTPEVSGSAMARLILDEKMNGVTGKYYQINEAIKSSKDSYDTDKAIQLWTDSERLVRL
jgi:hypothetical protein